jgi:hypothetical protein
MPLDPIVAQVLRDFFEEEPGDSVVEWLLDNNIADPKALKAHLLKMASDNRAEAAKSDDTEENEWLLEQATKYEKAASTLY